MREKSYLFLCVRSLLLSVEIMSCKEAGVDKEEGKLKKEKRIGRVNHSNAIQCQLWDYWSLISDLEPFSAHSICSNQNFRRCNFWLSSSDRQKCSRNVMLCHLPHSNAHQQTFTCGYWWRYLNEIRSLTWVRLIALILHLEWTWSSTVLLTNICHLSYFIVNFFHFVLSVA